MIAAKINKKHAPTLIRSVSAILDDEHLLHTQYFREWGILDKVSVTPQSPNCLLYTSYLANVASNKPAYEGLAAYLPCFWIYAEVGKYIAKNATLQSNPYEKWISTYSDASFENSTLNFIAVVDSVSDTLSLDQKAEMMKHFGIASLMEFKFWQIHNNPWDL